MFLSSCFPVHGGWNNWSPFSTCSVSCGGGSQSSFRSCINPVPQFGGNACDGNAELRQPCNEHPCPGNEYTVRCQVSEEKKKKKMAQLMVDGVLGLIGACALQHALDARQDKGAATPQQLRMGGCPAQSMICQKRSSSAM